MGHAGRHHTLRATNGVVFRLGGEKVGYQTSMTQGTVLGGDANRAEALELLIEKNFLGRSSAEEKRRFTDGEGQQPKLRDPDPASDEGGAAEIGISLAERPPYADFIAGGKFA